MRSAVAMLAAVLVAVAAVRGSGPTGPDVRVVNDFAAILGEWELVSVIHDGRPVQVGGRKTWVFRRDELTITQLREPLPTISCPFKYKLDPRQNPPWLTYEVKPNGAGFNIGAVFEAIYRLEGDMLRVCFAGGAGRPRGFRVGQNSSLSIFRRVTPPPPRPLDRLAIVEP